MNLRVRIKRKGKLVFLFKLFRVNSVQNLSTISVALGKERTRNELLPYIMDLMDDEEEILIVLAQSLNGQFLDHVGGPLFAPHLFKPLERLCEVEESTIRDKVSEGFPN
jgi:serine/threonine-protein phosphatase 2A regulatory subunit A